MSVCDAVGTSDHAHARLLCECQHARLLNRAGLEADVVHARPHGEPVLVRTIPRQAVGVRALDPVRQRLYPPADDGEDRQVDSAPGQQSPRIARRATRQRASSSERDFGTAQRLVDTASAIWENV